MKTLFSTRYTETGMSLGLFVLRASAGGLMIPHGYDKLINFEKYAGGFMDPFGLGLNVSLSLTIFAEFFCAILIVFGLLTRLAAIPLIIAMAVAVFIAHNADLIFYFEGEKMYGTAEHAGLYLAIFLSLLLTGPGKFSVDKMIGK